MAEILSGSIDLNLIDEKRVKVVNLKSGKVARFYDLTIFVKDEQDQYQNIASISAGQTKEEREKTIPKVYLGNLKRVWSDNKPKDQAPEVGGQSNMDQSDDLPF